jgi:hypothetical protein
MSFSEIAKPVIRYFHVTCAVQKFFNVGGPIGLRTKKIYCQSHLEGSQQVPQSSSGMKRKLSNAQEISGSKLKKRALSNGSGSSQASGGSKGPRTKPQGKDVETTQRPSSRERMSKPRRIAGLSSDESDTESDSPAKGKSGVVRDNDSSDDGGLGTNAKKVKTEVQSNKDVNGGRNDAPKSSSSYGSPLSNRSGSKLRHSNGRLNDDLFGRSGNKGSITYDVDNVCSFMHR